MNLQIINSIKTLLVHILFHIALLASHTHFESYLYSISITKSSKFHTFSFEIASAICCAFKIASLFSFNRTDSGIDLFISFLISWFDNCTGILDNQDDLIFVLFCMIRSVFEFYLSWFNLFYYFLMI